VFSDHSLSQLLWESPSLTTVQHPFGEFICVHLRSSPFGKRILYYKRQEKIQSSYEEESKAIRVDPPENPTQLENFVSSVQFQYLAVRDLKQLLVRNRVSYEGCRGKKELVTKFNLWNQWKRDQEGLSSASYDNLCKICMDATIDCVMLECGHMATCTQCGKQMNECPICRQCVVRVVHTFKS
ncbi:unnamed protein product, partial [Cyprideis torosa]